MDTIRENPFFRSNLLGLAFKGHTCKTCSLIECAGVFSGELSVCYAVLMSHSNSTVDEDDCGF